MLVVVATPSLTFIVTTVLPEIFNTGFEGPIDIAEPRAGSSTLWEDCGAPYNCENNASYCTQGCTDSVTGYNVPADFPGDWRVGGTNVSVWNHTRPDETLSELDVNTSMSYVKNGSQSMRSKVISQATSPQNRNQMNV